MTSPEHNPFALELPIDPYIAEQQQHDIYDKLALQYQAVAKRLLTSALAGPPEFHFMPESDTEVRSQSWRIGVSHPDNVLAMQPEAAWIEITGSATPDENSFYHLERGKVYEECDIYVTGVEVRRYRLEPLATPDETKITNISQDGMRAILKVSKNELTDEGYACIADPSLEHYGLQALPSYDSLRRISLNESVMMQSDTLWAGYAPELEAAMAADRIRFKDYLRHADVDVENEAFMTHYRFLELLSAYTPYDELTDKEEHLLDGGDFAAVVLKSAHAVDGMSFAKNIFEWYASTQKVLNPYSMNEGLSIVNDAYAFDLRGGAVMQWLTDNAQTVLNEFRSILPDRQLVVECMSQYLQDYVKMLHDAEPVIKFIANSDLLDVAAPRPIDN